MSSKTEVKSRPSSPSRAAVAAKTSPPQSKVQLCDLRCGDVSSPATKGDADRFSVDPMRETDRYRLVQAMPLPQ